MQHNGTGGDNAAGPASFEAHGHTVGILANTISPTLVIVPGFGLLGFHVAFTLSMLAAFVERPFVTRAGVSRYPLCASLRANFITTIVGLACTPIAFIVLAFPPLILVWWPIAVWVSYRVEYWCYDNPLLTGAPPPLRAPIFWGNVVSNAVFFVLIALTPEPSMWRLRWLHSLEPWLTVTTAIGCACVYTAAFLFPAAHEKLHTSEVPSTAKAAPPLEASKGLEING